MPSGIKTEEVVPSPSGEGGWPKARRMRCSMNRIERIQAMEAFLNETSDAVVNLANALEDYAKVQEKVRRLSAYYGSDAWYGDIAADQRGRLPEDLARGVLSEDLIYDMIVGNRDNALRMLEIGTEIMRKL